MSRLLVRYPAVLATSLVAGLFSLVVSALLVIDFASRGTTELFDSPAYLTLKEQLSSNPDNTASQETIRALDKELRAVYFHRRQFTHTGICLLLGGAVLTVVTARWAAALRRVPPHPQPGDAEVDRDAVQQQRGRWAACGIVAAVLVSLGILAFRANSPLPANVAVLAAETARTTVTSEDTSRSAAKGDAGKGDAGKQVAGKQVAGKQVAGNGDGAAKVAAWDPPTALPTAETYAAQWPRFRGPAGSGVSAWSDMPDQWDGTTGEGILWKVEVPLPGYNSPIVWEDRVFLSGATDGEQAVFCFDADSGALRWRRDIPPPAPGKEPLEVSESTGYAAPTMATDGIRAYAVFASGDVVAVDFEGNQLWCKRLGPPESAWGHASSLATYGSLLIVQFDQGKEADGRSRLMALDGATGSIVWEVAREVPASWASPIVVPRATGDGHLLITSANPWVIAYSPDDGREVWRARCLGGEIGPSPVMHAGIVYAANVKGGLSAIRADGQGDVTDTHIEWRTDINAPDVSSPLVTDEYVLLLKSGLLACFDRKGGDDPEPLWEEDLMEDVSSSPALVGDRVYIFSDAGPAWVLQPKADQCERIRECQMGEPCRTSPAFQPGRIYIRGDQHLFCIGAGTAEEKPGQ